MKLVPNEISCVDGINVYLVYSVSVCLQMYVYLQTYVYLQINVCLSI